MPHKRASDQTTLTISLSKEQADRLREYAAATGITVSEVLRMAIQLYAEQKKTKSKG